MCNCLLYTSSVIDNKVSEVINKYNLKLTVFDEVEFLDGVKNLLQKEDSDKLEKLHKNYQLSL